MIVPGDCEQSNILTRIARQKGPNMLKAMSFRDLVSTSQCPARRSAYVYGVDKRAQAAGYMGAARVNGGSREYRDAGTCACGTNCCYALEARHCEAMANLDHSHPDLLLCGTRWIAEVAKSRVPDNQRRLCLGYERGQIDAGECRLEEDVDLRNNPLVGSGWLSRQNLFQHAI